MQKSLLFFSFIFFYLSVSGQQQLIWTSFGQGQIQTCQTDGTNLQEVISFSGASNGIKIDQSNELIYWTNRTKGMIFRTDFNAQIIDTIVSGLDEPEHVEIDGTHQKIYWTDSGEDKIKRANLDGTDIEDIFSESDSNPMALFMDEAAQELYFSKQSGFIGKINLANLSVDNILTASGKPTEIEVDTVSQKIYWSNQGNNVSEIMRANLNGSNIENLVTDLGRTYGIALDTDEEKIYWTDWGGSFPKLIKKANLDGTNVETVIELNSHSPYALSLVSDLVISSDETVFRYDLDVDIYPNPSQGQLNIKGDKIKFSAVKIVNNIGQIVLEQAWNEAVIDISGLTRGMYFVVVETGDGVVVRKVVRN